MEKVIKCLEVPKEFFKEEYFLVEDDDLRKFLTGMKGFVDYMGDVYFHDDVDIKNTIQMHTGDCRIWLKDGGYIVPRFRFLFMETNYGENWIHDIYEWMAEYTPRLFDKHIEFDRNKE